MALVRILVDGYGLLQSWPALAPGKSRHSEGAREELINHLTQYFDATATPLTIVFDGATAPFDPAVHPTSADVEVVFSRPGQTASQLIERLGRKLSSQGDFLVATPAAALRETMKLPRCALATPEQFIQTVETTLADLEREIEKINEKEKRKFTYHG